MGISQEEWLTLSQAYAFLGNTLLAPITQTEQVGLDPAFWKAFPDFDDENVRLAADDMAERASSLCAREDDPALAVAVEYTHLFIGPPSPAAAPWETFYRSSAVKGSSVVGFGEATFAMRRQLRALGLELSNENNQYEDHMGIELLCLAEMCRRVACDEEGESNEDFLRSTILPFITERPLSWSSAFAQNIANDRPAGYYAGIASLADALLRWHAIVLP